MKRNVRGQSLVELGTGMMVLLPLVLVAINMGFIGVGASINDAVCRDAVRAAAAGPPALKTKGTHKVPPSSEAYKRALSVLKTQAPANASVSVSDQMEIDEKLDEDAPSNEVGGAVIGEITVRTKVTIVLPFQLQMFSGPVIITSAHIQPFTYAAPPEIPKEEP